MPLNAPTKIAVLFNDKNNIAMQNLSFDHLPEAVQKLSVKLDNIELLLKQSPQPDQSTPQDEILTTKQAAEFLHIQVPTLYSYVSKKRIASCKRGKHLYFVKADLIEFVKSGRQKAISEIETEAENYLSNQNKKG